MASDPRFVNPAPLRATGANQPPTGARHWLLAFASALAVITFIDRVLMSQTKLSIATDLKLTDVQMGTIFSAFGLAYALFEIPGGWLGDKIGPRKVLMRVVMFWSIFTAATGRAWNYASLAIMQFLFGAGEAGAFPNLAKAFNNWLPAAERSRAVGVMWLSSRWGGAVTPLLVVWVIGLVGWRWTFAVFAIPGFLWAILFWRWFRDHPRDHPSVNAAELALLPERQAAAEHVAVPWAQLLRSRTVWLLFIQYFCFGYGWYFYITWLPTYVKEVRHMELQKGALLSGIPLFFGGFACILSGWLAGNLARRGFAIPRIRRTFAYIAYGGAAALLLVSSHIADPVPAMLAMGLASFCLDLVLPVCWSTAMDVGGKYAGTVSGTMNMAGQIGGAIVGPSVVGFILQYAHRDWGLTFAISAAIYVIGGLCWLWIDPVTPVAKADRDAAAA
ncbi:MAG TPA: MFS transporter [Opitutaceae bacterium]|nr:MFS transporter [Opitutaceae bacterium]